MFAVDTRRQAGGFGRQVLGLCGGVGEEGVGRVERMEEVDQEIGDMRS